MAVEERKRELTERYFADRIEEYRNRARELRADDREDEAVFARVQMNVYEIFQTVFSVAVKNAGQEDSRVVSFFLTRIRQIPENWRRALALEEQQGNPEKAHIEGLKLAVAREIQGEFERIWEVNP